jgi:hypothetical protein
MMWPLARSFFPQGRKIVQQRILPFASLMSIVKAFMDFLPRVESGRPGWRAGRTQTSSGLDLRRFSGILPI